MGYQPNFSKPELAHMRGLDHTASPADEEMKVDNDVKLSFKATHLHQLSFEEREKAMFDVHGISEVEEEEPTKIEEYLEKIEEILPNFAMTHRGLALAMLQDYNYVMKERVKFLRAASYNPAAAAKRMAKFFEMKKQHFPEEALGRDLTLRDLPPSDWDYWTKGFGQFLKEKDAAGRIVFFYFGRMYSQIPIDVVIRNLLYNFNKAAQDESAQKNGIVVVDYSVEREGDGAQAFQDRMDYKERNLPTIRAVTFCLPLRLVSRHYCFNDIAIQQSEELLMIPAPAYLTVRSTFHFGKPTEVINRLATYGIQRNSIPINENDGSLKLGYHTAYLEYLVEREGVPAAAPTPALAYEATKRQSMTLSSDEEDSLVVAKSSDNSVMSMTPNTRRTMVHDIVANAFTADKQDDLAVSLPTTDIVWTLGQKDIVMGRGHHNRSHPGNLLYRNILEQYKDRYHRANRVEKMVLGDEIMAKICENGSRFVSPQNTRGDLKGYKIEPLERARYKMTHDLRNLKRGQRSSALKR